MNLKLSGALLLSSALVSAAHAAPILTNGSLEPDLVNYTTDGPQNSLIWATTTRKSGALTGWTITAGSIDIVNTSRWNASLGNYSVDLIGSPGLGSIQQTVSGFTPGSQYILSFDLAANPETYGANVELLTTRRLEVNALDGTTNAQLASESFAVTKGAATATNMNWTSKAITFTATSSSVTFVLSALLPFGLSGGLTAEKLYCGPVIDNLVLAPSGGSEAAAPEPASLAVLGLGTLGLLSRRARR